MGIVAESIVAYAQPLLDETEGSLDQVQKAMNLAQTCWNLALLPKAELDAELAELQTSLGLNSEDFGGLCQDIILPMIRRHHEMFPNLAPQAAGDHPSTTPPSRTRSAVPARTEKYPGTGRNASCPCNSGKKYKRCCGQ